MARASGCIEMRQLLRISASGPFQPGGPFKERQHGTSGRAHNTASRWVVGLTGRGGVVIQSNRILTPHGDLRGRFDLAPQRQPPDNQATSNWARVLSNTRRMDADWDGKNKPCAMATVRYASTALPICLRGSVSERLSS